MSNTTTRHNKISRVVRKTIILQKGNFDQTNGSVSPVDNFQQTDGSVSKSPSFAQSMATPSVLSGPQQSSGAASVASLHYNLLR